MDIQHFIANILIFCVFTMMALLLIASGVTSWRHWLKHRDPFDRDMGLCFLVFGICILLTAIAGVISC